MHRGVAVGEVAGGQVALEVRVVVVVGHEEVIERLDVLHVAGLLLDFSLERAVRDALREADQVLLDLRLRPVAQTCTRAITSTHLLHCTFLGQNIVHMCAYVYVYAYRA